jgi:predicted nuclease of predicted toxin-antitoxin system
VLRWLADECVDAAIVMMLRGQHHDVLDISGYAPATVDADVTRIARKQDRRLLTEDKDFGELVIRRALTVPGLVLIRIPPELRSLKLQRVLTAVEVYGESLSGRYTVIEPGRFRSRPLRHSSP